MKKTFELSYKNNPETPAVEIMKKNVQALETLCKQANKEGFQVELYSPNEYKEPKNVYELSAMLAEDMVKKYNAKNTVIRSLNQSATKC